MTPSTPPLKSPAAVLIVPGIGNSGPEHWQTLWERNDEGCRRVEQRDWDHPVCSEWMAVLDAEAARAGPKVVVAAHSLGCLLVVRWTSLKRSNIAGALLVAVPDPSSTAFPSEASGFAPVPDIRLDFPTVVVASTDDPYGTVDFARSYANVWGSRFVSIGAVGHINAASGLGSWPVGFELLAQLRKAR
jgi:uncharacterized protein